MLPSGLVFCMGFDRKSKNIRQKVQEKFAG
jgi:hypothetical protein